MPASCIPAGLLARSKPLTGSEACRQIHPPGRLQSLQCWTTLGSRYVLDYQTRSGASSRVEPLPPPACLSKQPLPGRFVAPQPWKVGNLAAQRPPSSSRSCPDLSSLRISPQVANAADPEPPVKSAREFTESTSRSSSPETPSRRSRSRKLASTGKRASRKARSVLDRFRALHRKAAAKMAHSSIKVDTNVHGTKRGFSHDDDDETSSAGEREPVGAGGHPSLPPFLDLPVSGECGTRNQTEGFVN